MRIDDFISALMSSPSPSSSSSSSWVFPKGSCKLCIREVWAHNLDQEFALIRELVDDYPYVAMDTEFPGVVVRPIGIFRDNAEYHYQTIRANVDLLKVIQLGLTFSDGLGNLPPSPGASNDDDNDNNERCAWQFNFREFDAREDVCALDSIELLRQSGIDFARNGEIGVDAHRFGELLMSSGVVLNDGVRWITFHSGYDFGYLLKLLTCQSLPSSESEFFRLLKVYFPTVYDIKYLVKFCDNLHGGLNRVAEILEVERIGPSHQAGSDSLLTSLIFWKLHESLFKGSIEKYAGVLYGLGMDAAE